MQKTKKPTATDLIKRATTKTRSTYKLPKVILNQLSQVMEHNDRCDNPLERVTREEVVSMLKEYGWRGSVHSLNRALKANFGRSFSGVTYND